MTYAAKSGMIIQYAFQSDGKMNIWSSHHISHPKIFKSSWKIEFLEKEKASIQKWSVIVDGLTWMTRVNFRPASRQYSSLLAPVTMIWRHVRVRWIIHTSLYVSWTFPELKISAVVLGSRRRITTAPNRYRRTNNDVKTARNRMIQTLGLYSALRACNAMVFSSNRVLRSMEPTTFLKR